MMAVARCRACGNYSTGPWLVACAWCGSTKLLKHGDAAADIEPMRHHVTTYTPTGTSGSWELRCTCGHLETITRTTIESSGLTAGEYLADWKRDHRAA